MSLAQPHAPAGVPRVARRRLALLTLLLTVACAAFLVPRISPSPTPRAETVAPPVAERSQLVLNAGRLHRHDDPRPFTGLMVEQGPDGVLRSRSAVVEGLLHGLSEGWHSNGQLQVTEHFQHGVSHGLRTKWSPGGARIAEASIDQGRLHGPFRRWHENGQLAEEVEFDDDLPYGTARAYYASGYLKSKVQLEGGQPASSVFFQDGEQRE